MAIGRLRPEALAEIDRLMQKMDLEPFDDVQAALAREAFQRCGRGRHPARLNLGDCSYVLARQLGGSLLFKGDDFGRTDIRSALAT